MAVAVGVAVGVAVRVGEQVGTTLSPEDLKEIRVKVTNKKSQNALKNNKHFLSLIL